MFEDLVIKLACGDWKVYRLARAREKCKHIKMAPQVRNGAKFRTLGRSGGGVFILDLKVLATSFGCPGYGSMPRTWSEMDSKIKTITGTRWVRSVKFHKGILTIDVFITFFYNFYRYVASDCFSSDIFRVHVFLKIIVKTFQLPKKLLCFHFAPFFLLTLFHISVYFII